MEERGKKLRMNGICERGTHRRWISQAIHGGGIHMGLGVCPKRTHSYFLFFSFLLLLLLPFYFVSLFIITLYDKQVINIKPEEDSDSKNVCFVLV